MPILNDVPETLSVPTQDPLTESADLATVDHAKPITVAKPSFNETLHASFRIYNDLNNIAQVISKDREKKNSTFNVDEAFQTSGLDEKHKDAFNFVDSQQEFNWEKKQLEADIQAKETIKRAGWIGVVASVLASTTSPFSFVWGGTAIKALKAGQNWWKAGAVTAAVGGTVALGQGIVAQEARTKEIVTDEEVYLNAAAGTIISGAFGAGGAAIAKHLSKKADIAVPSFTKYNENIRNISKEYMAPRGLEMKLPAEDVKVIPEFSKRIAKAYDEMPHAPNDPEVQKAYSALISETSDQFDAVLKSGLQFSKIKEGQANPYKTSADLHADIKNNNHIWYFPTEQGFGGTDVRLDNPLLAPSKFLDEVGNPMPANDVFRIVHDYFGHAKEGSSFGPNGEESAWLIHNQMFSPLARRAMTTETRGQNSWVNFGPKGEANRADPTKTVYADQKTGLLPEWAGEVHTKLESNDARKAFEEEQLDLFTNNIKHVVSDFDTLGKLPLTTSEMAAFSQKMDSLASKGLIYDPALTGPKRGNGMVSKAVFDGYSALAKKYSTVLRRMSDPSAQARETFLKIADPSIKPNLVSSTSLQPSVEALNHLARKDYVAENIIPYNSLYNTYKKATPKEELLSELEFRKAATYGYLNGGKTGIAQVDALAEKGRTFFQTKAKDMVDNGLATPDIQKDTSYFPTMYKQEVIKRDVKGFKAAVRDHFTTNVRASHPELSPEELSKKVEGSLNHYVDSITGAKYNPDATKVLKEKTTNVPPSMIIDYIEDDLLHVMDLYEKKISPKINFAKVFSKDVVVDGVATKSPETFPEVADKIIAEYSDMIRGTEDISKQLKLGKQRDKAVAELKVLWDLNRGTYKATNLSYDSKLRSGVETVQTFNFITSLGGTVFSSVADVLMAPMREGYVRWLGKTLPRTIKGLGTALGKGYNPTYGEARAVNKSFEIATSSRTADLFGVSDPTAFGDPFSNFMGKLGNKGSNIIGINHWNDFGQSIAQGASRYRIMFNLEDFATKGKLPKAEEEYMNFMGLGADERKGIWDIAQNSLKRDANGDIVPDIEALPKNLRDRLLIAINKDVDQTIIMKNTSDVPIFNNTLTGRVIGQWQNFTFAFHNKVLIQGVQDANARTAIGLVGIVGGGMFVEALKNGVAGRDNPEDMADWVAAGLNRSGITGLAQYGNNFTSVFGADYKRLTNDSVTYDPEKAVVGALGPTGRTAVNIGKTTNYGAQSAFTDRKWTQRDNTTALSLVPFYNTFYLYPIQKYVRDNFTNQLPKGQR